MKKKTVVAMLLMCMALTATACGNSGTDSKTEAGDTKTEDIKTEDKSEDKEEDSSEDKSETTSSVRLVSVDDVSDYVTIGEYKGLTLDRVSQTITDEDVEAEINYELEDNGTEVQDGTVEDGDTVTINFTGTIDGKEFDGGSAEDYELVVGDGGMIDGFEEGIVGMKKGETKELDLTFPEDYYEDSVAGKAVVFKVTLQKFTRPSELSDEWVAANTDYTTVDEYRAGVKAQLEETAAQTADYDLNSNAWSEVLAASEVKEYPKEDVDQAKESYKKLNEEYVQEAGMEMADFLEAQGMSEEDYEDDCQQYAEYKVEQNLIVQGIMDAEGLTLEDDEMKDLEDEMLEEYGFTSIDEMVEVYGQQEVNESLALLRVERFIVDNATVNETTDESGDMINEDADEDSIDTGSEDIEEISGEVLEESSDENSEESEDAALEDEDAANEE